VTNNYYIKQIEQQTQSRSREQLQKGFKAINGVQSNKSVPNDEGKLELAEQI
jgi:hypothetical protein